MLLPNIPRRLYKEQKQIAAFGGLNLTEGAADGEFADSSGISADDYPSMRPSNDDICVQNGVTDIFEWDGNIVTIRNGVLYYNDDVLCNATPHAQFAVAGNKLLLLPDEICIDLQSGTARKYRASTKTTTNAGSVSFGVENATAVYAELEPVTRSGVRCTYDDYVRYENGHYSKNPMVYTYGKDHAAVRAAYQDGQWDLEALEELRADFAEGNVNEIEVGDILIPREITSALSSTFSAVLGVDDALPDKSLQNSTGYFAVVTSVSHGEEWTFDNLTAYYNGYFEFDVYKTADANQSFSELFDVGDWITISGTTGGFYDMTAKITAFETGKNVMTLDCDTLIPYAHWKSNVSTEEKDIYFKYNNAKGGVYKRVAKNVPLLSNATLLFAETTNKLYVRQKHGGETAYDTETTDLGASKIPLMLDLYYPNQTGITFAFKTPKLDYICAHQNRIYGVSNADKTLYISALGKPTDFYTYSGDADSYAVAVGSNGDFTAICAYGGGVLAFKENSLIKVFGSSPSDFYTNEYILSGVQKGSNRSLQVVDETLYYKGVYGIYAYTGGMPSMLSAKLGNRIMTDAVAGSDGTHYYVCMKDGTGKYALYVYDIRHGLWMKDRSVRADSFATAGGKLLMAAGGCQYTLYGGDGITHEWYAEFVPFGETVHTKKTYTTLRLRLDMQPGSKITVDVREDRAPWRTVFTRGASDALSLNIPLRIGRCDRLRVRLRGSGDVTVRSMVREMLRGSEV